MPNLKEIIKTIQDKMPPDTVARFDFPKTKGSPPEEVTAFLRQMESLLSKEQCLAVMTEQGCAKSGATDKEHREFGQMHEGKPIEEKLALLRENGPHKGLDKKINGDGTLTIAWAYGEEGNYRCICRKISRLLKENPSVEVPSSFCGCCGGHIRYHNEHALGVKLKLKEIVSSPLITGGEKRCEFLFEILE
ncbi:MAG: hypothetical protein FWE00_04535 [Defluviitaleaceae bacterium]|nr:hypothetical protein [Defluviitaleaceae bacterium]